MQRDAATAISYFRQGLQVIRHAWHDGEVRCVEDVEGYVQASRDAYVIDRSFVGFHAGDLFGIVCWGSPDGEDAARICRAREAELADRGPHFVVMDYRLLETVAPEAFATLARFLNDNREVLARVTSRTALLVPNMAFAAATVSGFYNVVKSPYESKVFTSVEDAEAWLGVPTVAPVTHVCEASAAGRSTTAALISLLERQPVLSLDDAAAALGTSGRTLQRKLQAENTNYAAEARKAVVRRAKHLLATTDTKIPDIATTVGNMTPQHFSEMFRAETGTTPAAWRAQAKKPG